MSPLPLQVAAEIRSYACTLRDVSVPKMEPTAQGEEEKMKGFVPVLAMTGFFFIVTDYTPGALPPNQVLNIQNSASFNKRQDCLNVLSLIQSRNPNYATECQQNGVDIPNPDCPFTVYGCFSGSD
jgi:hypothetical protein